MPSNRIRIFPILMVLFLAMPIIEIYLLIQVADLINWLPTIGLVVLTAVIGASLLRSQGSQTYLRFNQALAEGRVPANEILEGVALLVGGALLLTPGFFTDLIGFICLLPFTRRPIATFIVNRFNPMAAMDMSNMGVPPNPNSNPNDRPHVNPGSQPRSGAHSGNKPGHVIEGEVTHRSDD